jgi:hypothetical protein
MNLALPSDLRSKDHTNRICSGLMKVVKGAQDYHSQLLSRRMTNLTLRTLGVSFFYFSIFIFFSLFSSSFFLPSFFSLLTLLSVGGHPAPTTSSDLV